MDLIYLPLDPSGSQVANKVTRESHQLVNRPTRIAVPEYGAFFANTLQVFSGVTGAPLLKSQYRAAEMLPKETAKYGRKVCTAVLITDPAVTESVLITYQALGGWNNYSKQKLQVALEELIENSDGILWENILNVPKEFPPKVGHLHHVSEVYGAEYLEAALKRVKEAIATGDEHLHRRLVEFIQGEVAKTSQNEGADILSALTAHKALPNPHLQYAQRIDLVKTFPAVRKPSNITPAADATAVALAVTFQSSPYYSLYGAAQTQAQYHISSKIDFTDVVVLQTVSSAVQSFKPSSALEGNKVLYWRVRYGDGEGNWSDWSTATKFTTTNPYPAQGTILSTFCSGYDLWERVADGQGGYTERRRTRNSTSCGYVPPPAAGQLLSTFCYGTEKWGTYTNGSGGTYDQLIEVNSTDCGYQNYPPAGTLISRYCVGRDLWGVYADGKGGTYADFIFANSIECPGNNPYPGSLLSTFCTGYDKYGRYADGVGGSYVLLMQSNSPDCGFNPNPPKDTLLSTYCSGTTLMGRYADGNGGSYNQAIRANSTDCGYVEYPASGTLLSTTCAGVDKWGVYANGSGGSYSQLIQKNSTDCGYNPNPPNGTLLSTYCSGYDKYGKYANGSGGSYNQLIQANSADCGYNPYPPAGTLLATYCDNHDLWGKYANGSGGYTDSPIKFNASECRFTEPGAGTLITTFCLGGDLWGVYSNGGGGTYDDLLQANSPSCR